MLYLTPNSIKTLITSSEERGDGEFHTQLKNIGSVPGDKITESSGSSVFSNSGLMNIVHPFRDTCYIKICSFSKELYELNRTYFNEFSIDLYRSLKTFSKHNLLLAVRG